MNSRRFPSPMKPLWELRFTTQTPSLTLARPKIRPARIEPTKPAGADVVVRVLNIGKCSVLSYTRKAQPLIHVYKINNLVLSRSNTITVLGIIFDSKLDFS
ncbi:hypothetical protein AVEN_165540-1 [Araneus ventricosus]|uniref:Uncharacterized protein n=1 Tax=Araneus ventricosus TaxID=182803 RepID=A0A4Y2NKF0_ARAVE|nr:hypothetical protein AVEN_165540-1 [Araneus ventricosus]